MSTTAVPLRPVKKSGLILLVLALAVLIGAGAAWAQFMSNPSQITFTTLHPGTGPSPTDTDVVLVKYEGRLPDGTVFDAQEQAPFPVNGVVPGFTQGLKRMQRGGKYRLNIPADLGYGSNPPPGSPIPANSALVFDVELLEFKSQDEIRAMMQQQQMMQQLQQQQQGGAAAPAGPPAGGQ
ncbi:MAG: FKBP-type peptidyl-prolyl cis-trans isomerase [Sphingopyxis sp.]